jgi:hypothetical protein
MKLKIKGIPLSSVEVSVVVFSVELSNQKINFNQELNKLQNLVKFFPHSKTRKTIQREGEKMKSI